MAKSLHTSVKLSIHHSVRLPLSKGKSRAFQLAKQVQTLLCDSLGLDKQNLSAVVIGTVDYRGENDQYAALKNRWFPARESSPACLNHFDSSPERGSRKSGISAMVLTHFHDKLPIVIRLKTSLNATDREESNPRRLTLGGADSEFTRFSVPVKQVKPSPVRVVQTCSRVAGRALKPNDRYPDNFAVSHSQLHLDLWSE